MSKIVWLASYPKSGNTWLRAFLVNYLLNEPDPQSLEKISNFSYSDMASEPYEKVLNKDISAMGWQDFLPHRKDAHRYVVDSHIDSSGGLATSLPFKTHSNFNLPNGQIAITPSLTRSAIYIVRNPLDVVISYADHYGCSLKQSIETSNSIGHIISGPRDSVIPQYVGPWSDHVSGWLNAGDLPRLIIRYEDMCRDPHRAFSDVLQFLKAPDDRERLDHAVRCADFRNLQKQETEEGFQEKSLHNTKFFRTGGFGGWRKVLSKSQVKKITRTHGVMMRKMGYLAADGTVTF